MRDEPTRAVERKAKRYRATQGSLCDADFLTICFDEERHDVWLLRVDHRKQSSAIAVAPIGGPLGETDVSYRPPLSQVSCIESDLAAEDVRATAQWLRVFCKSTVIGVAIP